MPAGQGLREKDLYKMKRGSFGYLQAAKKASLIKSCLMLATVLIIFFAAYFYFHTKKNVFSILAAVGALPTGRSIVGTVMFMRAKSASLKVKEAADQAAELPEGCSGYDLYLTAYERAYSVSHLTVVDGIVAGITEDEKTDCALCEKHLRDMLRKDRHPGYEVHIYRDLDKYVKEIERLSGLESESLQEDREVMNMILMISL